MNIFLSRYQKKKVKFSCIKYKRLIWKQNITLINFLFGNFAVEYCFYYIFKIFVLLYLTYFLFSCISGSASLILFFSEIQIVIKDSESRYFRGYDKGMDKWIYVDEDSEEKEYHVIFLPLIIELVLLWCFFLVEIWKILNWYLSI